METVVLQKTDFAPSAKSIILTESFDKIINTTLANNTISNKSSRTIIKNEPVQENCSFPNQIIQKHSDNPKNQHPVIPTSKAKVAKKYFKIWKTKVKAKRKDAETKEKITHFLDQLKKQKETKASSKFQTKSTENETNTGAKNEKRKHPDISEIYKNRYKAQQDLIKSQQMKLQEQERIIQDLKLGVIMEETQKSLEKSKYEIQEIFRKCSERVKCKIIVPEATEKDINVIEVRTSKVPKIITEMDKRAEERAIRRSIILQKKRMMEEEKRKEIELAIASKKTADDEQKRKNLEAIKEQRRLETELDKKRQENKRKYLESINRADKFYKKKLKRKYFNEFKELMFMKIEFELKSELFYKNLLKKKSLNEWKLYVKKSIEKRYFDADCLHNYKVMKKAFKSWNLILVFQKQSMQVAEDLYDMRLQSRIFIHWHRYICHQQMIELRNTERAQKHYNSRILLHYFYQWKSLPAVIQLERAKEQRKRKWREKVWEILPDFNPCIDI